MRGWGYAVFGKIVSGMDVMDKISNVQTGAAGSFGQDVPEQQIIILKMSDEKPSTESDNTEPLATE